MTPPRVLEIERLAAAGTPADRPADLLVEVPHGATLARHFTELAARLRSELPADLREFFFVNTDVGAPECAMALARMFVDTAAGPRAAIVLRSLIPRTLCDCNRVLGPGGTERLTPGIPSYVDAEEDRALLRELHGQYDAAARQGYAEVCGAGGLAIALHSYAPRSIDIGAIGADVVRKLREAYLPGRYELWPKRPTVDVISEADDGIFLAPPALVRELETEYARAGIGLEQNATYRLHEGSAGLLHAQRYPGRVLCIEFDRAALAEPFTPFDEMRISEHKVQRMVQPLAVALLRVLGAPV